MIEQSAAGPRAALNIPLPRDAVARLERIASEGAIPAAVLQTLLRRAAEQGIPISGDELQKRLILTADVYNTLRNSLANLSNEDPYVTALLLSAEAMIATGDFIEADAKLFAAEQIDLSAIEALKAAINRRREGVAARLSQRAALARLRLDYRAEAEHFAAASTIMAHDEVAARSYRLKRAEALFDYGSEYGDNHALEEAIDLYRTEALSSALRDERGMFGRKYRTISVLLLRPLGSVRAEPRAWRRQLLLTERPY
jgi:hypothetical protein